MAGAIQQQVFEAPSVFSFFDPEYSSPGPIADTSLVAPEAGLNTPPLLIGLINGLHSLAAYGLTTCNDGFGSRKSRGRRCVSMYSGRQSSDGLLDYGTHRPAPGALSPSAHTAAVVADLDMLLTGGRLAWRSNLILRSVYESGKANADPEQYDPEAEGRMRALQVL